MTKPKIHQIINRAFILAGLMSMLALTWNVHHIRSNSESNTLEATKSVEDKGSYTIGNNPTDLNKTYFEELKKAVKNNESNEIVPALVKTFISEYFTWSNKDGNYDVGGMNYIYSDLQKNFYQFSLDGFYRDFDAAMKKYGRKDLLEVSDVQTQSIQSAESLEVVTNTETKEKVSLPSFQIKATWNYAGHAMPSSLVMKEATFMVVNHNGRYEIASVEYGGQHE